LGRAKEREKRDKREASAAKESFRKSFERLGTFFPFSLFSSLLSFSLNNSQSSFNSNS